MAKQQKRNTPQRKRGELERCWDCPREHPGWMRSELRNRRRLPRCPDHVLAFDRAHEPWPHCPQCDGSSFGPVRWNGKPSKTVAVCDECGFEDLASKYFDEITIKVIASPIELPN